jgi:hypothetical protein
MLQTRTRHRVSSSPADNIQQWYEAGGELQFYDYPLDVLFNVSFIFSDHHPNVQPLYV